jgi:AmmeMemoRadiSam system protein A
MASDPKLSSALESAGEYSQTEREMLLRLAHAAIEAALDERHIDLTPPTPHLAELRGAFTTLHLRGHLRGCVGYIIAAHPLWRTVAETAVASAFEDTRFVPVSAEEATHLRMEISVLSPQFPIAPEDVVVGKHGLIISEGARRGLLLPQVPIEYGWNREFFLEQTCWKAGLPADAWKRGARIEAFTAEVFSEDLV